MSNISPEEYEKCERNLSSLVKKLSGRLSQEVLDYSLELMQTMGDLSVVAEGLVHVLTREKIAISPEERDLMVTILVDLGYTAQDENLYFEGMRQDLDRLVTIL